MQFLLRAVLALFDITTAGVVMTHHIAHISTESARSIARPYTSKVLLKPHGASASSGHAPSSTNPAYGNARHWRTTPSCPAS